MNKLLSYARGIIAKQLGINIAYSDISDLKEKRGIFVTLKKEGKLRGCIGFTKPFARLPEMLKQASLAAAFEDPRFPPLRKEEFDKIKIEISILTEPKPLKVRDQSQIIIGKDGLIITKKPYTGLLLPQVAPEQNWNALEFLEYTCLKAGLPKDAWKEPETKIETFQVEIISE